MTSQNSNVLVSHIFNSRKILLDLMGKQGYNINDYANFSINEVNSMKQNNQLDMLLETSDDSIEKKEEELNENLVIYLKGINDGKWNTKTKSSKELGSHGKYLHHVHNKFGNVFNGVKELIGFPNPRVIRYHKYYDNIDNCKYEITENIKRLGYLPSRNDSKRPPLLGNNSISGVYEKYGVKEFQNGGIFYEVIMESLKLYAK